MRKRQWKKILSVVLALAMVFSMNVSAFADEVTDPVAVEEPAAEEPVAEAPVESNEETPEETKEEEPAAPAEEAEPAKGEEAAGGSGTIPDADPANNWTITAEDTSAWDGVDTTQLNLANATTDVTLAANASAGNIKLAASTEEGAAVPANITITNAQDTAATVTLTGLAGSNVKLAADTYGIVTTSEGSKLVGSDAETAAGTGVTSVTVFKLTTTGLEADDVIDYADETVDISDLENVWVVGDAGALTGLTVESEEADLSETIASTTKTLLIKVNDAYNKITLKARDGAPSKTITYDDETDKITIASSATTDEYRVMKKGSPDTVKEDWTDASATTTEIVTDAYPSGDYYVEYRVKAVETGTTAFASTAQKSDDFEINKTPAGEVVKETAFEADTTYTVSGLKVTTGSDAKGKFVSDNKTGIFTVDVTEGTVTIEGGTADNKAVSINLASAKSTAILDASDAHFKGDLISIKGTGLVTVEAVASTGSKIASIATGVSISGNAAVANHGIVVSNNKAYIGVENGVDVAVKVANADLATTIYAATKDSSNAVFEALTTDNYRENTIAAKAGYVLSTNNALGQIGAGTIDLTKNTIDPYKYGAKIWWVAGTAVTSGTVAGAFVYNTVPERNEQIITKVSVYAEHTGQSSAKFHIDAPYTLNKTDINSEGPGYVFALSTDAASANETSLLTKYKTASTYDDSSNFPDGEQFYEVSAGNLLKGSKIKEGTTYKIFAINNTSGGFWSPALEVGSFTTNTKQTLTIAKPSTPVYAGYQKAVYDEYSDEWDYYDASKTGVIPLTFDSTTIKYDENGAVYKDDVYIGYVDYYFLPDNAGPSDVTDFKAAEDSYGLPAAAVPAYETLSGNYYVKAFFTDYSGVYDSVSSATISFNIIPAPIKVSVKDSTVTVPEKEKIDITGTSGVTYINTITGRPINDPKAAYGTTVDNPSEYIEGTAVYVQGESATGTIRLTAPGNVSLNKGKYKYSVSKDSLKIKTTKLAPFAAKYVIDWAAAEAGDLDVFGEATLTAEAITVPYGTADVDAGNKDIKNNLVVKLDSTGTAEATKDFTMKFFDKKAISENGKEISNNTLEIPGSDVKTKDAGEEFYVVATYNGTKCTGEKPKSAPVLVTIAKRDITIGGKTYPIAHSKRNIEIKDSQVSFNAADFKGALVYDKKFEYRNTANTKFESPLSANTSGKLNKADIDITKADIYPARITEYKLDPDVDKNFNVTVAEAYYKIDPAYYAYWILEYAGRGAKTGKKLISFNEVTDANIDKPVAGSVKHVMPADITPSWNEAGKSLFAGTTDYISGWVTKDADGDSYPGSDDGYATDYTSEFDFDDFKSTGAYGFDYTGADAGNGDVYFYAVVTAKATENVTIESIAPVVYNGKKYVGNSYTDKQSKTANREAKVKLVDTTKRVINPDTGLEEKGYELEYGKDFKVTYKNNVNASVKINPALSENLSAEAGVASAVEQLFKENKRPQAVVTGIGDYKGLKATVYFDIYPRGLDEDYFTGLYKSPTLNITKINKNGKGIKYKYKVGDKIKGKTVTLKKKKDYTETFYSVPDFAKMNQKTVADAKKITAAGKYALIIDGTKNYRGQIVIHFDVKDKSAVLMSELGFKGKNVAYKGSTISSDSTGFNIKASKKVGAIKGSKLKNGTDFTIGDVDTDNDLLQLTIKDGMPVEAGSYYFYVEPTKALLDKGVIDDGVKVTVKIKNKALKANQFKVEGWPKTYTGNSDDVKITSKKLKAGTDYYAFPTSFTSRVQLGNLNDVVGFAVEDITAAFAGDSYVGGDTPKEVLEAYDELPDPNNFSGGRDLGRYYSGITYSGFVWKLTAKNGSKRFVYTLVPENDGVFSGYVNVIGKGAYAGSVVQVPYARKGAKLKDATISVDKCFANINGTEPAVYIVIPTADGKGKSIRVDNDKAYTVKYSNNKKASAKAKVTVKNSGGYGYNAKVLDGAKDRLAEFTGKQTKTFTIDKMPIKSVSALSLAKGKTYKQLAGTFYATVEDPAMKSSGFAAPKVTVYQYSEDGKTRKALNAKTDFAVGYDKAKVSDNQVSLNACAKQSKSSFTIEKTVPVDGLTFNVYEKKAKKYNLEISGYKSVSASGVSKNATYDEKKKGVVYTGERIEPIIGTLEVDGESFVANGVSNNKVGSYELVITQNDLGKVGVVKYQILLKRADGVKYTLGGSKQYSFKIIPQENNKLILTK